MNMGNPLLVISHKNGWFQDPTSAQIVHQAGVAANYRLALRYPTIMTNQRCPSVLWARLLVSDLVLSTKLSKGSSTTVTMYANTAAESVKVYLISRSRNFCSICRHCGTLVYRKGPICLMQSSGTSSVDPLSASSTDWMASSMAGRTGFMTELSGMQPNWAIRGGPLHSSC